MFNIFNYVITSIPTRVSIFLIPAGRMGRSEWIVLSRLPRSQHTLPRSIDIRSSGNIYLREQNHDYIFITYQ